MTSPLPVLFITHASPFLATDVDKGNEFRAWGKSLPTPKAILVFSAHWETNRLSFGETSPHTQLIYDFGGFPDDLYQLQYPAPGATEWLEPIRNLLEGYGQIEETQRGLDHGVWVPFLHLWPEANIPILQMTMPSTMSNQDLFDLGRRLAPLREQGVLIISSGALTHNLREAFRRRYAQPPEWVTQFDQWVVDTVNGDRSDLLEWETRAPFALENHPTPEHFRPLLIAVGAASEADAVQSPITGYEMGVFSRRCIEFYAVTTG